MEISEYDQYVPERELNMNFRIPRKRTAEESFGPGNDFRQTSPYGETATKVSAYGNADSRAPSYSNYRARPQLPELDLNRKPTMPSRQNTSFGNGHYASLNNTGFIEYPRRLMGSQSFNIGPDGPLRPRDPTGSLFSRNRDVPLLGTRRQNIEGAPGDRPLGWNNPIGIGGSSFRGGMGGGNNNRMENDFGGSRSDFGRSRSDFGGSRADFGGSRTDFGGSRNDFGGSRTDFGGSRTDFGGSRNDFGENGNGFNGNYRGGFSQSVQNRKDFRNDNVANQEKFEWGQGSCNRLKNPRSYSNQKNTPNKNWNKTERPKLPKPNVPPVTIPDASDNTLPKELREMFQPLFCKLCSLQMTSNVMAKMHYVSKNHEKKIRKYLIEYSEKTGEPLHPRAKVSAAEKKEKEEDKNPRNFYCDICDLQLTGKQHADSHYMGKSHNAVRLGKKKPAGKGSFDPNGKWTRKSKEESATLAEGDDPFGMDFRKKPEETEVSVPKSSEKTREKFTCSLCSVCCVSQDQLNIHLSGSKHKKKLKLNGLSFDNFVLPKDSDRPEGNVEATPENAITTVDVDHMLKIKYITPNGYFYCKNCNLTVNSEIQFKQHLGSKNHAKKAQAKKVLVNGTE